MTAWDEARLGELFRIKHGYAFKGEHFDNEGQFLLLTPGNFDSSGGLVVRKNKETFYGGEFPDAYLLNEGDLVIAMTDLKQEAPILGSTLRVPESGYFLHNQRLGLVQEVSNRVDVDFLYYLLNDDSVRWWLRATATGSTVRHTAPERIYQAKVRLPPIATQRAISEFLRYMDDLIENNRRRIEILEEMARLLYWEWFVHFRFPGHEDVNLVDSDLGPIPEGWSVGEYADLVSEARQTVPPNEIPDGAPVVGLEHLPRRSTTLQNWESASSVGSRRKIFEEGDILFAKIRPYFHKVVDAPFMGYASTDAIVFRPKSETLRSRALAVASSDDFVSVATATSNGTRMPRANTGILMSYRTPHPTPSVDQAFNEVVAPMDALRKTLAEQSRCLREARDLLLPRLVSGELDVSELDLNVEAVGV